MELEAVYYSGPAPASLQSLTLLGLVFDRLIFPGVYIPEGGFDAQETLKEIERIRSLPGQLPREIDAVHMVNLMLLALNAEYLKDFCVFTGDRIQRVMEPEAGKLTYELEQLIFGPLREGFIPTPSLAFYKGLPGSDGRESIISPSWISYPANALLYAGRTGTVLVNDSPLLPVPSIGGVDLKANAKQLSTIMALESVKFMLPNIRPLSFEELAEFRSETRDLVQPFRRSMLKLSKELNSAILSDATLDEVRKEAKFIVETTVTPELEQLREELAEPNRPWHRKLVDAAKDIPEIVGAFAALPWNMALATALARVAGFLADIRDDQLKKEGLEKRGGFHYLLKLEKLRR